MFGIGDKNLMLNSGSYFIIQVLMFAYFLKAKLINWVCTWCASFKFARSIGMFFYEPNAGRKLFNNYLKFFMESYFDLSFGIILNSLALYEAVVTNEMTPFISGRDNIVCTVLTIIYVVALAVFPLYVYFKIRGNFGTLNHSETRAKIGFLYDGVKTKKGIHAYYNVIFLFRRLLTSIILIFLISTPIF